MSESLFNCEPHNFDFIINYYIYYSCKVIPNPVPMLVKLFVSLVYWVVEWGYATTPCPCSSTSGIIGSPNFNFIGSKTLVLEERMMFTFGGSSNGSQWRSWYFSGRLLTPSKIIKMPPLIFVNHKLLMVPKKNIITCCDATSSRREKLGTMSSSSFSKLSV